ncbi:hypothetical protein [Dokdonella sp.]
MQSKTLRFTKGFRLAMRNRRGQAAQMTIPRGDATRRAMSFRQDARGTRG